MGVFWNLVLPLFVTLFKNSSLHSFHHSTLLKITTTQLPLPLFSQNFKYHSHSHSSKFSQKMSYSHSFYHSTQKWVEWAHLCSFCTRFPCFWSVFPSQKLKLQTFTQKFKSQLTKRDPVIPSKPQRREKWKNEDWRNENCSVLQYIHLFYLLFLFLPFSLCRDFPFFWFFFPASFTYLYYFFWETEPRLRCKNF